MEKKKKEIWKAIKKIYATPNTRFFDIYDFTRWNISYIKFLAKHQTLDSLYKKIIDRMSTKISKKKKYSIFYNPVISPLAKKKLPVILFVNRSFIGHFHHARRDVQARNRVHKIHERRGNVEETRDRGSFSRFRFRVSVGRNWRRVYAR